MKFSVAVLLLLWCIAVKSDDDLTELRYRDEQIIENEIQSEEEKATVTNVSSKQICEPDIHTVLRELSTKLAEQTVELRYTKIQMSNLEKQMEELKKQNEAAEIRLEELKRENGGQALELRTLQMRSNITEGHVRELRREDTYRIAFSASIAAHSYISIGPFNTAITLKYANVYVNNGNAYNPNTGIFTTPVRGVYMFRFSITGHGSSSTAVGAWLYKNNQFMVVAYVHQPSLAVSSTNGASLLLEVGDVVFVQLVPNTQIYDNENHLNTFSGQLLFTV